MLSKQRGAEVYARLGGSYRWMEIKTMNIMKISIILVAMVISACAENHRVSEHEFNELLDKVGQGTVVEYDYMGLKNGRHIIRKWEMNLTFPGSREKYYVIGDSGLTRETQEKIAKTQISVLKIEASGLASPTR